MVFERPGNKLVTATSARRLNKDEDCNIPLASTSMIKEVTNTGETKNFLVGGMHLAQIHDYT